MNGGASSEANVEAEMPKPGSIFGAVETANEATPVAMAFCPDCGAKKVGKFCTQCGRKLGE